MHHRSSRLSGLTIAAIITGPLVLAVGLILGRIPRPVPGGFSQSIAYTSRMCTLAHRVYGGAVGQSPMCVWAHAIMVGAGALIVVGLGLVSGAVAARPPALPPGPAPRRHAAPPF